MFVITDVSRGLCGSLAPPT